MSKITAYGAFTAPTTATVVPVVDPGDTSMAASGTTKKMTTATLMGLLGFLWPSGDTTGVTDQANLVAAMNTAQAGATGGRVLVMPGNWYFNLPVMIPPGVTVEGVGWSYAEGVGNYAVFNVNSTGTAWSTGSAPIQAQVVFADKSSGGWTNENTNSGLAGVQIQGTGAPAGTRGLAFWGTVQNPRIERVHIDKANDRGIEYGTSAAGSPDGVHMLNFKIQKSGKEGIYAPVGMNDCQWTVGHVTDSGQSGTFSGIVYTVGGNQSIAQVRSEWSSKRGWEITNNSSRSGGIHHIGCSTDRSNQDGFYVTGTGTAAVVFEGCFARRDGKNGTPGAGGGGYAGLLVSSATCPVIWDGSHIGTGVNDDGTGAESPQYGIVTVSASQLSIGKGHARGVTAPMNLDAASTVRWDPDLLLYSGTGAAPVALAPTVAVNANAGTGAAISAQAGNDAYGRFTLTTGSASLAAGVQAAVTFATTRTGVANIIVQVTDTTASPAALVTTISHTGAATTGFNVTSSVALTASHAYRVTYWVMG